MIEELKEKLEKALKEYENNEARLRAKAYDEGGQTAVDKLRHNYTRMRNEYMNLLKIQLDENAAGYRQLIEDADKEASELKKSLGQLEKVTDIINLMSSVAEKVSKLAVMV